jgi:hypothetical protein
MSNLLMYSTALYITDCLPCMSCSEPDTKLSQDSSMCSLVLFFLTLFFINISLVFLEIFSIRSCLSFAASSIPWSYIIIFFFWLSFSCQGLECCVNYAQLPILNIYIFTASYLHGIFRKSLRFRFLLAGII